MNPRIRAFVRAVAVASLGISPVLPVHVSAQQAPAASPSRASANIFTSRDAVAAAAFVLGTAAIMPLDRAIAVESQRPALHDNAVLNRTMTGFRLLGEPGSIVIAGATYIYGRADNSPRSAELGLRTVESIAAAGLTTFLIKGVAGRARPYVVDDTIPRDYQLGRGFHGGEFSSFPSGHTTTAFAAASAASQEIRYLWPHASPVWTPALFASATLVGISRIHADKHWASDVIAGAAVGTIVARVVVRYNRAHEGNAVDRLLLPARASHEGVARSMGFSWNYLF